MPHANVLRNTARALAFTLLSATTAGVASGQVQVTIFDQYPSSAPSPTQPYAGGAILCQATAFGSPTGFSIDFSDATAVNALCGTGASSRINNFTSFGARFVGSLIAPSAGMYGLTVDTDDGDVLTINGHTYDSNWIVKGSGPGFVSDIPLTAGVNPFILDYFQGPPTGAYASFSVEGITIEPPPPITGAPEPSTIVLLAAGLAGAGVVARRRA